MAEKRKVLVTGGAGYIGSHTVIQLIESGFTPIILDDFRNAKSDVIARVEKISNTSIIAVNASCDDEEALLEIAKKHDIWGIIHFAADKAVGESVHDPLKYYQNNLGGLVSILSWAKKSAIKNIVFSSSCTVYGEPENSLVTEETPLGNPPSPYGRTKLMCEQILRDFSHANKDFKIIALRYFNPIGAHESALIGEEPQGIPNNLLPYITQTAIGEREALTVYGNTYNTSDGTCVRDYIHVVDVADAHVKSLEYILTENNLTFDVFNIGTGKGTSVLEFILAFEEIAEMKLNWSFGEKREGDVPEIYAIVDKAKNRLNWSAKYSVKEGIRTSWKWEQNKS